MLPQLLRYCSFCLLLLNISLFFLCFHCCPPFVPLSLSLGLPPPPPNLHHTILCLKLREEEQPPAAYSMGVKITLKLLFTVNKIWGEEVKSRDRMNNWNVLFIAVFHHSQRNYLGGITTNCVCAYLLYLSRCSVYVHATCGCYCVCTCGALIPASPSNYLNCAYRSYCTVHFPLESNTLSSCLPAALAVEISTLGNFVLHNKYCTWGMFLSKNVWTERKTAR